MTNTDRHSRLAAALRENLKRRKRQSRERVREKQPEQQETTSHHIVESEGRYSETQVAQEKLKFKGID